MKMLQLLKKIVLELGELKYAWLTSFNISPSFVEGYILPVLAGVDEKPRTIRDFEIIQKRLTDSSIDVRFFCDFRVAELNEGKKTAVPFHLLSSSVFGPGFKYGVFHPKVILLQNRQNLTYLITGSANLTTGGWAHNRECVFADIIRSERNAEKIETFFHNLFDECNEVFPPDFQIRVAETEEDEWLFHSSITDSGDQISSFLDSLLEQRSRLLYIWSPYFAEDLPAILDSHIKPRMAKNAEITIIPDLQEKRIRIAEDTESSRYLAGNNDVHISQFNYPKDRSIDYRMTHAKFWCTESTSAIGSWNLTKSGVGLSPGEGNNVEAGVLVRLRDAFFKGIEKGIKTVDDVEFMSKDEIENDKPDLTVVNDFLRIRVEYDWQKRRYTINLGQNIPPDGFLIRLPDVVDSLPLNLKSITISNYEPERLLRDHLYFIERNGETIQSGVIVEINLTQRSVWKFNSLNELLYSYIINNTSDSTEKHSLAYGKRIDKSPEVEEYVSPLPADFQLSYFSVFRAFDNLRQNIEEAMDSYKQNPEILLGYIQSYPGSLMEISRKLKDDFIHNEKRTNVSQVFRWFLYQEMNSLIDEVVKFLRKDKRTDQDFIDFLLGMKLTLPGISDDERVQKYLHYIKKNCNYAD